MAIDKVTVKLGDISLDIEGVYIPYDPGRMYYPDGSGQPPEPASFEITKIFIDSREVTDLINELDTFYYNRVEDKIKFISIWEHLDEKATQEFEKILE